MQVTYNHNKMRGIMVSASGIMLGQDRCIDPAHSRELLRKAWAIYKDMKRDCPSACDEYLGALAIGEASNPGHPWNRDNAERYVSQLSLVRFLTRKKGL